MTRTVSPVLTGGGAQRQLPVRGGVPLDSASRLPGELLLDAGVEVVLVVLLARTVRLVHLPVLGQAQTEELAAVVTIVSAHLHGECDRVEGDNEVGGVVDVDGVDQVPGKNHL